jgi:uncharacterized protein (DUF433 family)
MNLPEFMTQDADGYSHLTGHRIGLQDVIHFFNEGYSVDMLLDCYPTLSLPLLHKTIAFYEENQAAVDAYLAQTQAACEQQRATAQKGPDLAELRRRLQAMRGGTRV